MSKKDKQPAPPIYLDVEWLLGDQPEPRHRPFRRRSMLPKMVGASLGCCAVLLVLYGWPHLSTAWLQKEWSTRLANANSTDESLGLIMALSELGNAGASSVVRQLDDPNEEKRAVAFHALSEKIELARSKKDSGQLLALTQELKSNPPQSTTSKLLHGQLAAKILESAPKSSRQYSNIESICSAIVGSMNGNSITLTQVVVPKVPKPSDSLPVTTRAAIASTPVNTVRLSDWNTDSVPLPALPAPTMQQSSGLPLSPSEPPSQPPVRTKAVSAKISDSPDEPSSGPSPVVPVSPVRLVSEARSLDLQSNHDSATATATFEDFGLAKFPLEQLFPMLGSKQDHRVHLVYEELVRRGVVESVIDRAIDLARGNTQQRLTALDEIVRSDSMNPLPLLVWMAQTNERPVRQRAIAILGSMQDPEAMRRLRELVRREPDQHLQQQIQQALVAGGYANR